MNDIVLKREGERKYSQTQIMRQRNLTQLPLEERVRVMGFDTKDVEIFSMESLAKGEFRQEIVDKIVRQAQECNLRERKQAYLVSEGNGLYARCDLAYSNLLPKVVVAIIFDQIEKMGREKHLYLPLDQLDHAVAKGEIPPLLEQYMEAIKRSIPLLPSDYKSGKRRGPRLYKERREALPEAMASSFLEIESKTIDEVSIREREELEMLKFNKRFGHKVSNQGFDPYFLTRLYEVVDATIFERVTILGIKIGIDPFSKENQVPSNNNANLKREARILASHIDNSWGFSGERYYPGLYSVIKKR